MDFSQFTDQDLLNLIVAEGNHEQVHAILGTSNDELRTLADEAGKVYWQRQIDRANRVEDWMLEGILANPVHASSRQLVGEAAMRDLLSDEQLARAYDALEESEWSRCQVRGRQTIRRYIAEKEIASVSSTIEVLLHNKLVWAVAELVPHLPTSELYALYETMSSSKVLSRSHRHQLRCEIKVELKARSG